MCIIDKHLKFENDILQIPVTSNVNQIKDIVYYYDYNIIITIKIIKK